MSAVKGRSPNRDHDQTYWQMVHVRLDPDLKRHVDIIADHNGISGAETIRRLLVQGLDAYHGVDQG